MVLGERVVQVASENDTCAVNEHIKLRLILFFSLSLVEGRLSCLSLLKVIQVDKFVLYCFDQVLALIVISDVCHDDCGLVWELRGTVLQGLLVLADEDDVGSLVQVPESEGLTDTGGGTCDNDSLMHEVIHIFGVLN